MPGEIEEIKLRRVLNSRGEQTLEIEIRAGSKMGRFAAPSGASKGKYEAPSLDLERVKEIFPQVRSKLLGLDVGDQELIDSTLRELDGTPNFSRIGGNLAIAISIAAAKCGAELEGIPLYRYLNPHTPKFPYPLGNVLGGGKHAGFATAIQEYLSIPISASHISQAIFMNSQFHSQLKLCLDSRGIFCSKGDEGGWAPRISDTAALDIVSQVRDHFRDMGFDFGIGLDVAGSALWNGRGYDYREFELDPQGQLELMREWRDRYGLIYLEDPVHEDDFEGFSKLTRELGSRCIICGDDLFTTNPERLDLGIKLGSGNAVIVKPNQIGTLSLTKKFVQLAKSHGYLCVISHRSGENEDSTLAHLALGLGADLIKAGVVGGERIAKLNELIRISESEDGSLSWKWPRNP